MGRCLSSNLGLIAAERKHLLPPRGNRKKPALLPAVGVYGTPVPSLPPPRARSGAGRGRWGARAGRLHEPDVVHPYGERAAGGDVGHDLRYGQASALRGLCGKGEAPEAVNGEEEDISQRGDQKGTGRAVPEDLQPGGLACVALDIGGELVFAAR